jgi:hypothetical protein
MAESHDDDSARIDDEKLTDDGLPLPGEGGDDPMTRKQKSPLNSRDDPDTGLPIGLDAYR